MNATRPVALVTGAARRVGRAVAVELARRGFDLHLTCHRRRDDAAETVALARRAAGEGAFQGRVHACDFADPDAVEDLGSRLRALPRLDTIVHNASVFRPTPLASLTAEEAVTQHRINALAPLLLTRDLADHLRRSELPGGGAVVCFGDVHAPGRPRRDHVAYAMSKAALAAMVRSLALDLAPRVRVNGIAPGVVAWAEGMTDTERDAYLKRVPLARAGTPEDAAEVCRWLLLDATYVTGEIVRLDGGRALT